MRFGRLREDFVCGVYLFNTPVHVRVQALGLVPYAERPGWGASPDGLIIDSNMKWTDVPAWTRSAYSSTVDITRGALEIKCSQANCLMRDYYYPQVYLEMMALGAAWADVVRYSEHKVTNGAGVWTTKRECRVYRVYRHKPTEDRLMHCIVLALNTQEHQHPDMWKTEPFTSLRNYFAELASTHHYKIVPVSEELYQSYELYMKLPAVVEDAPLDEEPTHKRKRPAYLNDVEERQLEIFRLFEREDQASKEFVALLIAQVRDLLGMLEEKAGLQ